jgi:hypothetical protein
MSTTTNKKEKWIDWVVSRVDGPPEVPPVPESQDPRFEFHRTAGICCHIPKMCANGGIKFTMTGTFIFRGKEAT